MIDVVTPTCNRHKQLTAQAEKLGPQLRANDRWIIVDDASQTVPNWRTDIVTRLGNADQILIHCLTYVKGDDKSTVNRARSIGCNAARANAWIVEVDDHDLIEPGTLETIRGTICRGAVFIYGDFIATAEHTDRRQTMNKENYTPMMFRDQACQSEGIRAFPAWLYHVVGGYRWRGPIGLNGNEFPGGDYGLFVRMELFCDGQAFIRLPVVLCTVIRTQDSIGIRYGTKQSQIAGAVALAAREVGHPSLSMGPCGDPAKDAEFVNQMMERERT